MAFGVRLQGSDKTTQSCSSVATLRNCSIIRHWARTPHTLRLVMAVVVARSTRCNGGSHHASAASVQGITLVAHSSEV